MFDNIFAAIEKWMRELLTGMVESNMSTMFTDVNVTNSNEGEGLLFYGNTIIPFKDKFDTSLKLYGLMTTKPNEIAKYREKKDA